ncbi:unnamed protein product [Rhizopus stolonifer]
MFTIFHDHYLFLKWDDSVHRISSIARKRLFDEEVMVNRVNMRVMTNIVDDTYDVSTAKFADWLLGTGKLTDDHKKALRESKVILDNIINCKYTSKKEARRLIMPCFQASGLDGELSEIVCTRIIYHSIYRIYTYLWSCRRPEVVEKEVSAKIVLYEDWDHGVKNAQVLANSTRKETREEKKKHGLQRPPSNDIEAEEVNTRWTRGIWFPNTKPHFP